MHARADVFAYFRAPLGWRELARRTIAEIFEDRCPGLAAQLAFYFLLALFPALLFLVGVLAQLPIGAPLDDLIARLQLILPSEATTVLQGALDRALMQTSGGVLTFAIAGALWSSSSAMTAIISALNTAYDIEEWRPWWKRRLIAIALTLGLAAFAVLAFVLVVGGTDLLRWIAPYAGAADLLARAGTVPQWFAGVVLIIIAADLIYRFAPNADAEFVWITPGALLATALWLAASYGFRLYVQHFGNYTAVEGAIGGVVVLMLWFYVSGLALLAGAELNSEIDNAMPHRAAAARHPGTPRKIGPAAEKQLARERHGRIPSLNHVAERQSGRDLAPLMMGGPRSSPAEDSMQRTSHLIGKPIVSVDTGERLGTATDLLVSPDASHLVGVIISSGRIGGERGVLPFDAVQTLGHDVIVAKRPDGILDSEHWHARGVDATRSTAIDGKKVVTQDGRQIGTVADLCVDEHTGAIEGVELSDSSFGGLVHRRRHVSLPAATIIGPDAIVVPPDVETRAQQPAPDEER